MEATDVRSFIYENCEENADIIAFLKIHIKITKNVNYERGY